MRQNLKDFILEVEKYLEVTPARILRTVSFDEFLKGGFLQVGEVAGQMIYRVSPVDKTLTGTQLAEPLLSVYHRLGFAFPNITWWIGNSAVYAYVTEADFDTSYPLIVELFGHRVQWTFWVRTERNTAFIHAFSCKDERIQLEPSKNVCSWDQEQYDTLTPILRQTIPVSTALTRTAARVVADWMPSCDAIHTLPLPEELKQLVVARWRPKAK